jgi:hypothetical protein
VTATVLARVAPALGLALAASLALAAGGCVLHLGDDDDTTCDVTFAGGAAADVAVTLLLDPETLTCVQFDFGGGCGTCEPCPEPFPPMPTWGSCQTQCTGLGEVECGRTPACRTAYDHACLLGEGACPALTPFLGCFAVDTTGPIQGACDGLDAFECSRHDDCLATYRDNGRCSNGLDDDGDGQFDENDECRTFGLCMAELGTR